MFCKDGEYNVMASLFFQTPEASVRSLFHDRTGKPHCSRTLVCINKYNLHGTLV